MIKEILERLGIKNAKPQTQPSTYVSAAKFETAPAYIEKEADSSLYDFKEVTLHDMKSRPDAIHDMFSGKSDGFLIKNFLSSEEVDKLLDKLNEIKKNDSQLANVPEGFTYPLIIAEYNQRVIMLPEAEQAQAGKKYFQEMDRFNHSFVAEYGVDVQSRITDFFSSIAGGRKVDIPQGLNDEGHYTFATFRYLVPNQGLMSVHCANYFGKTFKKAYAHLNTKIIAPDQMSYFIMLQEPHEGGELSLFNFRWQDGQTKKDAAEDNEIIQPDGTKMYVQTDPAIRKNKIRPRKGDMILFQGGNIWHRIERVKGTKPRITFGGFLSLSHDKNTVYFWS
ncbi:MAG: 2OG-Fe(II) oxygenase [Chitinophagales bacterium]